MKKLLSKELIIIFLSLVPIFIGCSNDDSDKKGDGKGKYVNINGCVDFTGRYALRDPRYVGQQVMELNQDGCARMTQTMRGENGLVFGPIDVVTDGGTRNSCSSDGLYCVQSKYLHSSSEFISEEIHSEYGVNTSMDKNTMTRLPNGDIKILYNHINYQSSSGNYSQEVIGKRLPQ